MNGFPKIEHECSSCGGSGKEDVSRHGSPVYEIAIGAKEQRT